MMLWSATDFPTPLRPRMQTISPGNTSKLTFLENDPISKCFGDVLKLDVGRKCLRSSHGYQHGMRCQRGSRAAYLRVAGRFPSSQQTAE